MLAPSTLRGRLALTYVVLIAVFMAFLGVFLVTYVREFYTDRLADQLEFPGTHRRFVDRCRWTPPGARPISRRRSGASVPGSILASPSSLQAATCWRTRWRIPSTVANLSTGPGVAEALRNAANGSTDAVESRGLGTLAVTVPIAGTSGMVARLALPLTDVNHTIRTIQESVIVAAVFAALAAASVAVLAARRITGPLSELREQAVSVAQGNLDASVTPVATRELGDLARAFNAMTVRIKDLVSESQEARARLEAIFANLTDGVVIIDGEELVLGINGAALQMLGISVSSAIHQPFAEVVRDSDLIRLTKESMGRGETRSAQIEYARQGRAFDAVALPVTGSEEHLGVVVIRDVTELRRLEQVRREFVANVSHELRTPLSSIRALVETLEAGAIDDPDVSTDFLSRIVGEVDRLTALVDELLDLARIESGRITLKLEAVAPSDLICGAVERFRTHVERARLSLVTEVPETLPLVLADRSRIEQVLLNLLHNATKFTPAGGTIWVRARASHGMIEIEVEDTGAGIPAADVPRVFERFFKLDRARRSEGTGLGLGIAKHIVQAHKGTISVRSEVDHGSTFTFSLPLASG